MKIGIDASRYGHSEATGVEWYSFYIINNLIELIAGRKNDELVLYSKHHINFDKQIREIVKKNKKQIKNKLLYARKLWTLWKLSKEMKNNPPDVLFVPSHVLPLKLPKKSVIMIHDVAFKHLRKSYSYFAYHYLDWSTKFAVKHATKIIVPSEATEDDLVRYYHCPKDKIEVVYHGFDAPDLKSKDIDKVFKESEIFKYFEIKKDSKYILFVGRLESKKNLIRLVEGFAEYAETHSDYRLILAGKRGVGFDELLKVVKQKELLERVLMPGYVTEEEKAALYKYCEVFAFPSFYEGFGLPILEAFYYKKPVLTSHVSCLPEVAGDAAYYVDPFNPGLIAKGLEKLVVDKNYREKLVILGQERLKLFKWKDSAKKTLDIILK
jgi:glycosyltransferase involved in cell wall biosynthesis